MHAPVQPLRSHCSECPTLFGVPVPLPTPQGRRAQQLKTRPERLIAGCTRHPFRAKRQLRQTYSGRSALGCSKSRRSCCSAPQSVIFRNHLKYLSANFIGRNKAKHVGIPVLLLLSLRLLFSSLLGGANLNRYSSASSETKELEIKFFV